MPASCKTLAKASATVPWRAFACLDTQRHANVRTFRVEQIRCIINDRIIYGFACDIIRFVYIDKFRVEVGTHTRSHKLYHILYGIMKIMKAPCSTWPVPATWNTFALYVWIVRNQRDHRIVCAGLVGWGRRTGSTLGSEHGQSWDTSRVWWVSLVPIIQTLLYDSNERCALPISTLDIHWIRWWEQKLAQ